MALNNLGLGFLFTAKDLATGVMKKIERQFGQLENVSTQSQARIKKGFARIGAGAGLFIAGAIGARALSSTVQEARNFGKAIGEVSTLVDTANFPIKTMKELTMGLAEQYGLDALQQAPALYQAISAGATDVKSATEIMHNANKFAIGGVTDLTTGVDVLTSAVNAFKSQSLTAQDAADTMFVTIKAGKTTAKELGSSLGRVLPIANTLGIKFTEVNAAIAATTANGLQTRRAVTGMNAALANVVKPSKRAQNEAKRMGISFTQAALRSKGLGGFLKMITGSAKYTNESMSKLFTSTQGFNFMASLASNNGQKFSDVMGEMRGRQGAADAAFKKMNGTLDQQIKRYNALKKNIKITIGEALAPLIKVLITAATFIFKMFRKLPKSVQKGIAIFLAFAAAAAIVGGIILFVSGIMLVAGPAFAAFGAMMIPFLIIFLKIAAVIAIVVAAYFVMRKAWRENTFGIRDDMKNLWKELQPVFQGLKQALIAWGKAWMTVFKVLKPVLKQIAKNIFIALIVNLKVMVFLLRASIEAFKAFASVIGWVVQTVGPSIMRLGSLFKETFDVIMEAVRPVGEFLAGRWANVVRNASISFAIMGNILGAVAGKIKKFVTPVFSFLKTVLDAIIKSIKWLLDKAGKVIGVVKSAAGFVSSNFKKGVGSIGGALSGGTQSFGPGALPAFSSAGGAGTAANTKSNLGFKATGPFGTALPSAGGGETTVNSQIDAEFTFNMDGEKMGKMFRRIRADNKTRQSQ